MKIQKEKRIRRAFVTGKVEQVATLISKSIGILLPEEAQRIPKKNPRAICHITGKTRSVIKGYWVSRHIYRKYADNGYLEGVRRGTW